MNDSTASGVEFNPKRLEIYHFIVVSEPRPDPYGRQE